MKLLYHEAKLASLSYILVLRYIYATLQPTREIAHVFIKKAGLALPPFHEFTGCDTVNTSCHLSLEIIGVVFADMFFYTIKKCSSLRSTDEAKGSFFDLAHIT